MILRKISFLISVCVVPILVLLVLSCQNDLNFLVHKKGIDRKHKGQILSVTYPEFKNKASKLKRGCDSINGKINSFVNGLLLEMECDQDSQKKELKLDYELSIFAKDYVSTRFRIYKYNGGAHGYSYFKCFNYKLRDAKELCLADVFHLESKTEIQSLNKLLEKYFKNPENCFEELPVVTLSFDTFSYQKDFFVFSFSDYSLGPYVCGTLEINIPIWDLKQHGLLKILSI